jgi:hypothetical protein
VSIDRHLVSTEEVRAAGASFDAVGVVMGVALVAIGLLAIRWLRRQASGTYRGKSVDISD